MESGIIGGLTTRDGDFARRPHPRGGGAHVRAGGIGASRRLGRGGHQDRARRAGRRHARPGRPPASRVVAGDVHALLEHSNRGKRSLGLDLTTADGLEILYKLAATSDVFLTNKLPSVRTKLTIGVDEIRAAQPATSSTCGAPARASAGPTPTRARTTRSRSGPAPAWPSARKRPEYDLVPVPPAGPGFGDSIGAMTIAGGIMGALFHRERTGEATVVDVSLLGTGLWAMGQAIALSLLLDDAVGAAAAPAWQATRSSRNYMTKDGRALWRSRACRPASTGRRCASDRPARTRHRSTLRRPRGAPREQRRGRPTSSPMSSPSRDAR